jgi:hypothetical protein
MFNELSTSGRLRVIVMTPLLTADSTAFSDMLGLLECD